jgi:hypothetical protein
MPGFIPHNPNGLDVMTHADRLARQQAGKWGLVFSGITAISLGVVTTKLLIDMVKDATGHHSRGRSRD